MIDIRKFESLAKEYVKSGEILCFRIILHNGKVIERLFSPIDHDKDATEIFYARKHTTYSPINGYIINDVSDIDFNKVTSFTMNEPTLSTQNGCILHTIEQLLKSNYIKI